MHVMLLPLATAPMMCSCGAKRRRLCFPAQSSEGALCHCKGTQRPAAQLLVESFPVITTGSNRCGNALQALWRAVQTSGPTAGLAQQRTIRKRAPDTRDCAAAPHASPALRQADELPGCRTKPEQYGRINKSFGILALRPLGRCGRDPAAPAASRKRPLPLDTDSVPVLPRVAAAAAAAAAVVPAAAMDGPAQALRPPACLRPIPASEQFARRHPAAWSPTAHVMIHLGQPSESSREPRGCAPPKPAATTNTTVTRSTSTSASPSATSASSISTSSVSKPAANPQAAHPPAETQTAGTAATEAASRRATAPAGSGELDCALPPASQRRRCGYTVTTGSGLTVSGSARADITVTSRLRPEQPPVPSAPAPLVPGSVVARRRCDVGATQAVAVGVEMTAPTPCCLYDRDLQAAAAAPSALPATAAMAAAAVTALFAPHGLQQRGFDGRGQTPGSPTAVDAAGQPAVRLTLRLWPLARKHPNAQPQLQLQASTPPQQPLTGLRALAEGAAADVSAGRRGTWQSELDGTAQAGAATAAPQAALPAQQEVQQQHLAQGTAASCSAPHTATTTGSRRQSGDQPPRVSALAGLERLLKAAEAAAAAAAEACCVELLTRGPGACDSTAPAATPLVAHLPSTGSAGRGASSLLPTHRVEPEAFFEVDNRLLKGAVLQTACNAIRLVQLLGANRLTIAAPWAPGAAAARSTGGASSGALPVAGLGGFGAASCRGGSSSAPLQQATSGRQAQVPLAAVLKVLVAFAGASRAMQRAQAAAGPAAAVEGSLSELLPLMRRGHACSEALMAEVERVLVETPAALEA